MPVKIDGQLHYTRKDIAKRGWTDPLVAAVLGPEDERLPNPYHHGFALMRLWDADRVRLAESHPRFANRRRRRKPVTYHADLFASAGIAI